VQDVIGRTIYGESFDALSGREVAVQAALAEGLLEIQKRISNPLRNYYTKGTQRLVENMYHTHAHTPHTHARTTAHTQPSARF
jgi:hypothetical protein